MFIALFKSGSKEKKGDLKTQGGCADGPAKAV